MAIVHLLMITRLANLSLSDKENTGRDLRSIEEIRISRSDEVVITTPHAANLSRRSSMTRMGDGAAEVRDLSHSAVLSLRSRKEIAGRVAHLPLGGKKTLARTSGQIVGDTIIITSQITVGVSLTTLGAGKSRPGGEALENSMRTEVSSVAIKTCKRTLTVISNSPCLATRSKVLRRLVLGISTRIQRRMQIRPQRQQQPTTSIITTHSTTQSNKIVVSRTRATFSIIGMRKGRQ